MGVNPVSLGLYEAPATGADIVVGEGQPFGSPMTAGGPIYGIFACSRPTCVKCPAAVVARSRRRANRVRLTLSTREQQSAVTARLRTLHHRDLIARGDAHVAARPRRRAPLRRNAAAHASSTRCKASPASNSSTRRPSLQRDRCSLPTASTASPRSKPMASCLALIRTLVGRPCRPTLGHRDRPNAARGDRVVGHGRPHGAEVVA